MNHVQLNKCKEFGAICPKKGKERMKQDICLILLSIMITTGIILNITDHIYLIDFVMNGLFVVTGIVLIGLICLMIRGENHAKI